MEVTYFPLLSLPKDINGSTLFLHKDNNAAANVVESGSNKLIWGFFKIKNINLHKATWIRREKNKGADFLTKVIGHDDWIVNSPTFKSITKKMGRHNYRLLWDKQPLQVFYEKWCS